MRSLRGRGTAGTVREGPAAQELCAHLDPRPVLSHSRPAGSARQGELRACLLPHWACTLLSRPLPGPFAGSPFTAVGAPFEVCVCRSSWGSSFTARGEGDSVPSVPHAPTEDEQVVPYGLPGAGSCPLMPSSLSSHSASIPRWKGTLPQSGTPRNRGGEAGEQTRTKPCLPFQAVSSQGRGSERLCCVSVVTMISGKQQ